jgi:hypothetical protein
MLGPCKAPGCPGFLGVFSGYERNGRGELLDEAGAVVPVSAEGVPQRKPARRSVVACTECQTPAGDDHPHQRELDQAERDRRAAQEAAARRRRL